MINEVGVDCTYVFDFYLSLDHDASAVDESRFGIRFLAD